MVIRKLAAADGDAFRQLRLEAVRCAPAAFAYTPVEVMQFSIEDIVQLIGPDDDHAMFGAFDGPALVAMVGLRREPREKTRHRVGIWGVFTSERCQRQGLSRQLMAAAIAEAGTQYAAAIVTLAVEVQNAAAIALYRSLGFCAYGRIQKSLFVDGRYVTEDLMMLDLQDAWPDRARAPAPGSR